MNTDFSKISAYFGIGDTFTSKESTTADLINALDDPSWQKRTEAVRKLGEVIEQSGQDAQRIMDLLLLRLEQDSVAAVRAAAAEALSKLHTLASQESLVRVLNEDEDDDVRTTAVQALQAWGPHLSQQTVDELTIAYFAEESEYTRAALITTLGETGPLVPFDVLEAALHDDSWLVRESAALTMGKQGLRANTETLEALLDDAAEPVCKAAIYALTKIYEEQPHDLSTHQTLVTVAPSTRLSHPDTQVPDASDDRPTRRFSHGAIEFYAYEPDELEGTKVVAQAIDNQWVPRSLLHAMLKGKITIKDAERYLEGLVRTEYIRSLINGERVIINRAYLYNSAPLVRDYIHDGASREAFKKLLDQKVIVPWLLYELSPDQKPDYGVLPQNFSSWQQICKEVAMHCVRFSWDKDTNDSRQLEFARDFQEFVQNLWVKDLQKMAIDLGLDLSSKKELFQRLKKMREMSSDYYEQHWEEERPYITRNVLYQQLISANENPAERVYDGTKPFSGEIKQLVDLFYNAHQADVFQGYILTPLDSPTRQILQEWDPKKFLDTREVGSASLFEMLRGSAFSLVQEGLYLRSMGQLTLQDVLAIRDTEIWQKYIRSLKALLEHPIGFSTLAQNVYYNYVELAKEMTHLIELRQRRQGGVLMAAWEPSTKIQIEVGAASLEIIWNQDGAFFQKSENAEQLLKSSNPSGITPVTVRWTIGDSGTGNTSTQAKLYSSFDIMRGKMYKAQKDWDDLIKQLRDGLKYKEFSGRQKQEIEKPTINEKR